MNKFEGADFHSSGNEFAAFNLGYDYTPAGGSPTKAASGLSEIVCNRDQNMGVNVVPSGDLDRGDFDPVAHDMALMHVFIVDTGATPDTTSAAKDSNGQRMYGFPLGTAIQEIGVYGSSMAPKEMNTTSATTATVVCPSAGPAGSVIVPVEYFRGNVLVIGFKKD